MGAGSGKTAKISSKLSKPNQQGCNAQQKFSRDIHSAHSFCTFGTKSYAQSALINNCHYYCPLLYIHLHVHFGIKSRAQLALVKQIWHTSPIFGAQLDILFRVHLVRNLGCLGNFTCYVVVQSSTHPLQQEQQQQQQQQQQRSSSQRWFL